MGEGAIDLDQRGSVLNDESGKSFTRDGLNKQWGLITEATRQDLLEKPEVRKALLPFCQKPVGEPLVHEFLSDVSGIDGRIQKLATRFDSGLSQYAKLPAVPNNRIGWLRKPTDLHPAEFQLVERRHKYARDIKVLALAAEIQEQRGVQLDEKGEAVLPSGTHIHLETNQSEIAADLLSPHLWERRTAVNDRVYEIFVNGRKYFLKEKKTPRHMDAIAYNFTLESAQEFVVAKRLREEGRLTEGDITLNWEEPLGFVTFPDGFQFVVFKYEDGLAADIDEKLVEGIVKHREQFEDEFGKIITSVYRRKGHISRFIKTFKKSDFKDYAIAKKWVMLEKARELYGATLSKLGYTNSDRDGYAFKVHSNGGLGLEIFGFDFEYFKAVSPPNSTDELEFSKKVSLDSYKESNREKLKGLKEFGFFPKAQEMIYEELLKMEGMI